MNKALYTIYAVAVLLFAGFARAEVSLFHFAEAQRSATLPINDVRADYQRLVLEVTGSLPSPCYKQPVAQLEQSSQDPRVLILRLTSPTPIKSCIAPVTSFESRVLLPELAKRSRVKLNSDELYVLKTEGFDFQMQVTGIELLR